MTVVIVAVAIVAVAADISVALVIVAAFDDLNAVLLLTLQMLLVFFLGLL